MLLWRQTQLHAHQLLSLLSAYEKPLSLTCTKHLTAYKSGTNAFIEFCLQYRRLTPRHSILPATEEILMLYASYLSLKVSPPTIKVYLAAVRNLHMEAGFPHLFDNFMLLPRLIRGIKRLHSHERRPRLPITPHILLRFKQHINLNWHDHHLLWSAMIVAFLDFLRSSELLALCEDILILDKNTSPPTFGLCIRSSKTDPFRHTVIRLPPTGDEALCPARAVSYLINQPNLSGSHSPLLQWSSGAAMTRQSQQFNQATSASLWAKRDPVFHT